MRQVLSVLAVLGLGTAALALADEVDQWERGFARPAAGVYVKGLEGPLRVLELEGSLESEVALASLEAHVVEGDISVRVTGAAQLR